MMLWPSAGRVAAYCEPMLPLAPGRFSMVTVWPQRCCNSSPKIRAKMSIPVPAVNGTTMVIGRSDNGWAASRWGNKASASAALASCRRETSCCAIVWRCLPDFGPDFSRAAAGLVRPPSLKPQAAATSAGREALSRGRRARPGPAAAIARDGLVAVGDLGELGGADDIVDMPEWPVAGPNMDLAQNGVGWLAAVGEHHRGGCRAPMLIVGLERAHPIAAGGEPVRQVAGI